MPDTIGHLPALLHETLERLAPRPGAVLVDGTLGAAGHAQALLNASGPDGRLLGIDRDVEASTHGSDLVSLFGRLGLSNK